MDKMVKLLKTAGGNIIISSIKKGLEMSIPIIMVGCTALVFLSLPLELYQTVLNRLFDGNLTTVIEYIKNATLGCITLILLITISLSYGETAKLGSRKNRILSITTVCAYLAFSGICSDSKLLDIFGGTSIFTAIIVGVVSPIIFIKVTKVFKKSIRQHTNGSDSGFNSGLESIFPSAAVIILFSLLQIIIEKTLSVSNLQEFFSNNVLLLFEGIGSGTLGAIIFVFSVHILWFFGMHGSNILDTVAREMFAYGSEINSSLIAAGNIPTEVFTKTFIDCFVMIGGCGSVICLIIAVLKNSNMRSTKNLMKIGIIPAIFNINEIIIFGLPIVFNPVYFIPFIITPVVMTLISFLAMTFGLVPLAVVNVEWTTPVLLSGFIATNSIRGAMLQIVNIYVGYRIYLPFVKLADRMMVEKFNDNIKKLSNAVQQAELVGVETKLMGGDDEISNTAKHLAADLIHSINTDQLEIYYQPQFDLQGNVLGVEALLRWNHFRGGFIYPPLIIALAKEEGILDQLGMFIIHKALNDMKILSKLHLEAHQKQNAKSAH